VSAPLSYMRKLINVSLCSYNTARYSYKHASTIPYFILGLTKTENRYCRWEYDIYGSYDNLNAAISACKADTNCGYVYDEECDNKGMFELCKVNAETKQSMQGSCIYKQRGKYHNLSSVYDIRVV
jgi:hypothetical protein